MTNEYTGSIQNPYSKLHKNHIDVYYTLLNYHLHYKEDNLLFEDGSFIITNEQLARGHECVPATISRALAKIQKAGLINMTYTPHRNGTVRKIYIVEGATNE